MRRAVDFIALLVAIALVLVCIVLLYLGTLFFLTPR